eukprot:gnl/TRDRNA2_/TRDRNA2_128947_c0_seq1.p1 gnl/TRDRNA2_/TRDRNA2_128947_c0~~gnl/TRDRNA2_/TRDRNA2_128947_c0_seq1.p1  ORF type:complete len:422 (+),score=91.20 gnl/TRDRNA2_/TRDRNA2_128947_c0_seq1:46-1266(+)
MLELERLRKEAAALAAPRRDSSSASTAQLPRSQSDVGGGYGRPGAMEHSYPSRTGGADYSRPSTVMESSLSALKKEGADQQSTMLEIDRLRKEAERMREHTQHAPVRAQSTQQLSMQVEHDQLAAARREKEDQQEEMMKIAKLAQECAAVRASMRSEDRDRQLPYQMSQVSIPTTDPHRQSQQELEPGPPPSSKVLGNSNFGPSSVPLEDEQLMRQQVLVPESFNHLACMRPPPPSAAAPAGQDVAPAPRPRRTFLEILKELERLELQLVEERATHADQMKAQEESHKRDIKVLEKMLQESYAENEDLKNQLNAWENLKLDSGSSEAQARASPAVPERPRAPMRTSESMVAEALRGGAQQQQVPYSQQAVPYRQQQPPPPMQPMDEPDMEPCLVSRGDSYRLDYGR